jgi:hypothetical protein
MGFRFSRRIPIGKLFSVNLSKSGVSLSARKGRVSVNSRGGGSIKVAKGLSYRFGKTR